jgi:acyl-CoA synthetase (AMP-forming)/AMP-acid ligase II
MGDSEGSLVEHVWRCMAARGPAAAEQKAIVDAADGRGLSLSEMACWAACVAREWRRGGVQRGDTVTLFLPNLTEYYVPVLAAWLCGAAVSCTDPDSRAYTFARHVKLTGIPSGFH